MGVTGVVDSRIGADGDGWYGNASVTRPGRGVATEAGVKPGWSLLVKHTSPTTGRHACLVPHTCGDEEMTTTVSPMRDIYQSHKGIRRHVVDNDGGNTADIG
jgi:hypothetical protein